MGAHFDNLRPGRYVAVIGEHEPTVRFTPFGPMQTQQSLSGVPMRVEALSYPFVCVSTFDGESTALDVRELELAIVSKKYAAAMYAGMPLAQENNRRRRGLIELERERYRRGNLIHQPHPRDCPHCHNRMVRRRTVGQPDWILVCKECGFERPLGRNDER